MIEGNKTIRELLGSKFKITEIYSADSESLGLKDASGLISEISSGELKKISFLQHPKDSVAVCEIPRQTLDENSGRNIVLDGIQDPGNLGTIIRLADWFGIEQIICSEDTVDVFNPKALQATMGSVARVNIFYTNIQDYLSEAQIPNLGTDMEGEDIYQFKFPKQFNLILGNEGNGIRPQTEELLDSKITIPRFGKRKATESLNVSMAAGIILGEIFSSEISPI